MIKGHVRSATRVIRGINRQLKKVGAARGATASRIVNIVDMILKGILQCLLISFDSKALPMAILVVCHPARIDPKVGLYAFELIINIPKLTVHLESNRVKG